MPGRLADLGQALLRRLAEFCIAALTLLTLADVLGRYVFNISVIGAVELTEVLMVGVIFGGIVMASIAREHVSVDLLRLGLGPRGRRLHRSANHLLAMLISLMLGSVTGSQARTALEFGDRTTMLGIPLAPVVFFMSAMLFVNAGVHALQFWRDRKREVPDD